MKSKLLCLVLLGLLILVIGFVVPSNSNEEEARKFVEDASKKLFVFYDKIVEDAMADDATLSDVLETAKKYLDAMADVVLQARQFDCAKFKDEELRRIFDKLKNPTDAALVGRDGYQSIISAMGFLKLLAVYKNIKGYENGNITLAYFPDIQNIFATSDNPKELEYYWNAWREVNSKRVIENFLISVNGIKDAANFTETSAHQFWMAHYNITEMDTVMSQIEPFYRQLHAFLRSQLNKRYGDSIIKNDELIPDHLFQQLLAQVWTNESVIEDYFPHTALPLYDTILEQNNYDPLKIFRTAENFYESMGFEPVPDSYWGTRLRLKLKKDKGDCKAAIMAGSPKVFMVYCHKMDFRKFLQAHGYMAEIHNALEKSHLPAYYFDSYGFEHAIGEAVILSASSPKHLATVGIAPDFKFTEQVLMNRLMRLSIHTMLNIPVYYVHTKVMADLFGGMIEITDLNKHYWTLMDKYVGVGPPSDRVSNTFDFPFKFYTNIEENKQARKFLSEVLGYQFYMKLCSMTGQYPKEQLQTCDFYGSKDAGDVMKKMMQLGSSKPFHEVLATMLPEDPKMNAESLLEYYSPVISWINAANQQNNVHVGWVHSDRKIESVQLPN